MPDLVVTFTSATRGVVRIVRDENDLTTDALLDLWRRAEPVEIAPPEEEARDA